ncbi:winged helix-turn-helix domain-containing protein [Pseudomonas sp. OST1909]|uniref:winged helix-turn-helix domain-containing protein n=1 Tax=Pseudomonas sp. OST1909 TaxID=2777367 RepID=UPI001887B0F4|nr:winged helix-turn-helix domain-containing protein [Pseudomonas sp. OST1909]QOY68944.1 winged helix-turn-helix transcriptional regulator [Pseudomonas sp. OST1909]
MGTPAPRKKTPAPSVLVNSADAMVAKQLSDLAKIIQQGGVDYTVQKKGDRMVFTVDSPDGTQRIIREADSMTGLVRESTELATKLPASQRRDVVKQLSDEGLTQIEIAKRTMTSQKTVSNDIKVLKRAGEL